MQQDLFGNEIEVPVKRPAASTRLGTGVSRIQPALPFPPPPVPAGEENLDENGEPIPLSLREAVLEHLHEHGLPYVDVHMVKQEFFRNADLRVFDFVVDVPEQPSWLLLVSDTSDAAIEDLRQWQQVFGPGFLGLVAVREYDDDPISFATLDGERIHLV